MFALNDVDSVSIVDYGQEILDQNLFLRTETMLDLNQIALEISKLLLWKNIFYERNSFVVRKNQLDRMY